jgi:hypothetical protein
MYVILRVELDDIVEFIIYDKQKNIEVSRYATYDEAFKDLCSR